MSDFIHLHVHTEYSLLDGACRLDRLIERAVSLNQKALAITDHGVMYGVVDFYKKCKNAGIKPIIGCEVYVAPRTMYDKIHGLDTRPYHLVLLCKNNIGYQNLTKIVSAAYIKGFYNKPRCDMALLKTYSEGIIALSACLAGEIPRILREGSYEDALKVVLRYKEIFGDDYYLELQNHGISEQVRIIPYLRSLSKDTDVKLVATNDVHYTEKSGYMTQKVLIGIATNSTVNVPDGEYDNEDGLTFAGSEFYLKSYDDMLKLFEKEELQTSVQIADKCDVSFEFGVTKLPFFKKDGYNDNAEYFTELLYKGIEEKYGKNLSETVKQRALYEFDIIKKMGFIDYFLIVADFVNYAKSKKIPVGPGRGSGAGSLAAYALGITGIDPIRHGLLFERFLNPERISMPDFDIDFCNERRHEVIKYVINKYGNDHVAGIITFGTLAARAAVRDAARAMGIPYAKADKIAKMIPFEMHGSLAGAVERVKQLRDEIDGDEMVKKLITTALDIEGIPRHASTHAAGIVITREPVDFYVPLQKNDEEIVTQYPMGTLEELGLLKMDFLGLRNLTVIDDCCRHTGVEIEKISQEDTEVYKMLSLGKTQGVFQFESTGMRSVLTRLKPISIEDLTAVISLYRPGPMASIPKYIENRHNPSKITYKHPLLESILQKTYGCIVYQEQVMEICRIIGGYSYGRADIVRRAMSKKKHDVMQMERDAFINGSDTNCGAVANGVPESVAHEIFDDMVSFASYAFNKSHAAAYALIAYQTAFLRCHYYIQYMVSLLSSVLDSTHKLIEYIADIKDEGVMVLPPCINSSYLKFCIEGDSVRFGLLAVKNLGKGVIKDIIKERESGFYVSLSDFCTRLKNSDINKRAVESLIKAGAFDCFPETRREMLFSYEKLLEQISEDRHKNIEGQMDLFSDFEANESQSDTAKSERSKLQEFDHMSLLNMEKEVLGLFVSGHPIREYSELLSYGYKSIIKVLNGVKEGQSGFADGNTVKMLVMLSSHRRHVTKKKNVMCFAVFEDETSTIEALIFADLYKKIAPILTNGEAYSVYGKISVKEGEEPVIIVSKIERAKNIIKNKDKYRRIDILVNECDVQKAVRFLSGCKGTQKAYIWIKETQKKDVNEGYEARITDEVYEQAKKIFGADNVKVI